MTTARPGTRLPAAFRAVTRVLMSSRSVSVALRIETPERGDDRPKRMHGRRGARQQLDQVDDALRQVALGGESGFEFGEFLAIREMVAMQQVNHFFKADLARKLIDVVTGIDKLPDFAAHIAERGASRDYAFQTFCCRC
jgi:hypothetical protein